MPIIAAERYFQSNTEQTKAPSEKPITVYTYGLVVDSMEGAGGLSVVINDNNTFLNMSRGYQGTTQERMELMAILLALKTIEHKERPVTVWSDSRVVVDALNSSDSHKNTDLWQELRFIIRTFSRLTFNYAPVEPELHEVALAETKGSYRYADTGYEKMVAV